MGVPWLVLHGTILLGACSSGDDPTGKDTTILDGGTVPDTDTGTPSTTETFPTLPTDTGTLTGPSACDPALTLDADRTLVPPGGLVQLVPGGGTGAYTFALAGDALGDLAPDTGFYLASATPGAVDEVVLTDAGCEGEARISLTVAEPLDVQPERIEVLPGTTFTVEAAGGSGSGTCTLAEAGSGATLSGCDYTAGAAEGFDRVVYTDDVTGESDESRITVTADAFVEVLGAERWVIPLGATFAPEALGGSNVLDLTVRSGTAVTVQTGVWGDELLATEAGDATVKVTDRFAGQPVTVDVTVVDPAVPDSGWYGQRSQQARVLVEDIDGDGFEDLVYGGIEMNGLAYYSGAVVIHAGTASGFEEEPSWIHFGVTRFEYTGRSMVLADVDSDGLTDLVVGADAADWTFGDVGEVRIFRGQAGAFFETTPTWTLRGPESGDRAGSTVGVCDVDGDGLQDVVVGAFVAEDRNVEDYPSSLGALQIHKGTPFGPDADAGPIRYGVLPVDGDWVPTAELRIGELGMATGDVDGDGRCDVLVGSPFASLDDVNVNRGLAFLYMGSTNADLGPDPARVYTVRDVAETGSELGREVALADLDGDGLDDVVLAAPYRDGAGGTNAGWVGVFRSSEDDGRPATEPYYDDEADWSVRGRKGSDYLGRDVASYDADGDGILDLVIAEPNGQDTADTVPNGGRVSVWSGAAIGAAPVGYDATEDEPLLAFHGDEANTYWGQQVALTADRDGDGWPDAAIIEGQANDDGTDVQRPVFVGSASGDADLAASGGPAGHEHGRAVARFDVDADGTLDLVVGSPEDGDPVYGSATGRLTWFRGTSSGYEATGTPFGDTLVRGSGDRMGYGLAVLDFDGDGTLDLAALARTDTLPSPASTSFVNPTECVDASSRSGSGLLAIWRGGSAIGDRTADWSYFPPHINDNIWYVASAGDVDDDGRDDVLLGSRTWDPDAVFAIVHGEALDPGGPVIVCEADVWEAVEASSYLGDSVAPLGDLDGDGCDDVAIGAPLEDRGNSNQGVVRVLWGAGGPGCPAVHGITALGPMVASMQAGESLASGGDVDGDGIFDLVVGGDGTIEDGDQLGTVWLVPGSYLLSLPRVNAPPGPIPTTDPLHPLIPSSGHYGLNGPSPTIDFGEAVALVPDAGSPGTHSIAVGAPDGDVGGGFQGGGVYLYRWTSNPLGTGLPGIDPLPWALVGGEGHLPDGRLGEVLLVDGDELLIGAPYSSQGGTQVGGAYAARF